VTEPLKPRASLHNRPIIRVIRVICGLPFGIRVHCSTWNTLACLLPSILC
jgi:hypothetical protein